MTKADWHYLYGTTQWKQIRIARLVEEPLCRLCKEIGRVTAADVVDHITPHKGDETLFFDIANHQSVCKRCHDSVKKRIEAQGYAHGCDINGLPRDTKHHWVN